MKKVALLVAGLVLFSIPLFAGEYLMNDTGETVYGLRVVFSEPVTLASFGDILTIVEPTGESVAFIFSGGERACIMGRSLVQLGACVGFAG